MASSLGFWAWSIYSTNTSNTAGKLFARRSEFELAKARDRAHILEGLTIALDNIEAVIKTIRSSGTIEEARLALIKNLS